MADIYVDPAATGSATGADWANAFVTIQAAFAVVVAGETIYCRGEQLLAAAELPTLATSGTTTAHIRILGCNASGTIDGTKFVIDGQSNSGTGLALSNYVQMVNVQIDRPGTTGIAPGAYNIFSHCSVTSGAADGWYSSGQAPLLLSCSAANCSSRGFRLLGGRARFVACVADGNTGDGFYMTGDNVAFGCLAINGNYGFNCSGGTIINSVAAYNTRGINTADVRSAYINNRLAYNGWAIVNTTKLIQTFNNYIPNTGEDGANTIGAISDTTYVESCLDEIGVAYDNFAGTDTDAGFNAPATGDYNLTASATMRDVEITLPE